MNKLEFEQLTYDLFLALGLEPPSNKLLHGWWAELEPVELNALETAYDTIIDLKATPTLKNVLMRVESLKNPIAAPQLHLKNKDKMPAPANLDYKGDSMDYARKILNNPKGKHPKAIEHANFVRHLLK